MDLSKFQEELARQGIDIVHPLDVRWYNEHVVEHELPLSALPTLGNPAAHSTPPRNHSKTHCCSSIYPRSANGAVTNAANKANQALCQSGIMSIGHYVDTALCRYGIMSIRHYVDTAL